MKLRLLTATTLMLVSTLQPSTGDQKGLSNLVSCCQNLTRISQAAHFYRQDTGKRPKSTKELTPKYLKSVPACPSSKGSRYAFAQTKSGKDLVLCWGENHKDMGLKKNEPRCDFSGQISPGTAAELYDVNRPGRAEGMISSCQSNLKNLATACEMYKVDHAGAYPPSMTPLTPDYITTIPHCPAAKKDSYSSSYVLAKDKKSFSMGCHGSYHKAGGLPKNFPAYDSKRGFLKR
jgi:hypothetical protein